MQRFLSIVSLALAVSAPVLAGEAKVTFNNVDDYADFRPANGVKDRFQQQRMDDLTAYFNELSSELPEGYTLTVTVEDVDLTGRLEPTFGASSADYVRVVRSIDYPRMEFSYQLSDGSGTVVKSEQVALKDMSFDINRAWTPRNRSESLYFEHKMLRDWFNKTFAEQKASITSQPAESA